MITEELRRRLFEAKDECYAEFQRKLMPTVSPERVIGVRTPVLRRLAREYFSHSEKTSFLIDLPHFFFEENNIHAFMLERITGFDECVEALDCFLPHVDNWATCDQMNPRVLATRPSELLSLSCRFIDSNEPYRRRFGILSLMRYFLDDLYTEEISEIVAAVRSDEYYVNMMVAWYFATALAKQYDSAVVFLEERRLDHFTHSKAIRKAIESYRVTPEHKAYLRSLL